VDGITPPLLVAGAGILLTVARPVLGRRFAHTIAADLLILVLVIALAAILERQMGRPLAYQHGPVRVWSGDVKSDQNSQQISDPYTFTHVMHGALFYGLTRVVLPSTSLGVRAIASLTLEAAWEVYENTDQVINRYRAETVSLGYYGDSVINSVADMLACLAGFVLTRRLPVRVTLAWIVIVEIVLALWIRDNLTLNILMLIHPMQAVRAWQLGT
jgi:uncharacterized protein DUF2585